MRTKDTPKRRAVRVRESALTILLTAARLWEARAAIARSKKLLRPAG